MNISSFKKLVLDRKEGQDHLSLNHGVAHAIRMKRREANLTQSEIAEGICSVSYLSKIENGKCHPENYYVREILNRMDIDINDCLIPDFHEELEQFLLLALLNKQEELEELFLLAKDQEVYGAKLIQFAYYLLNDEPYRDVMEYLNAIKSYLSEFELKTFMMLASLAELKALNYRHAMDFLDILLYLEEPSEILNQWIRLLRVKCAYFMGDDVKSLYYMEQFKLYCKQDMNTTRSFELMFYEVLILLRNRLIVEAKALFSKLKHFKKVSEDQFAYLHGMILFQEKNYEEAIKELIRVKKEFKSHSWLKIVECYVLLEDREHVELYCEIIQEQSPFPIHRRLSEFFYIKLTEDVFQVKDIIHDHLFSHLKKTKYYEYLELIKNEIIEFNRKNSRYKAIDELRTSNKSIT